MGTTNREPYIAPEDQTERFKAEVKDIIVHLENEKEELQQHDCKLSPDSGCKTCEKLFLIEEEIKK
jgi:hypothetical protein